MLGKTNIKLNYGAELGCVVYKDVWYILQDKDWLCKINLDTMEGKYVSKLPYSKFGCYSYKLVCIYKEWLLFIPIVADYIISYNISNNKFNIIKEYKGERANSHFKYRTCMVDKYRLLAFPVSNFPILNISWDDFKIKEYTEWCNCLPNDYGLDKDIWFGYGTADNDYAMIPCFHLNAVVKISLNTGKSSLHYIGNDNSRFSQMVYDGKKYWLLDYINQSLYAWNIKNGIEKIIELEKDTYNNNQDYTQKNCALIIGKQLLIAPCWLECFFSVSIDTGEVKCLSKIPLNARFFSHTNEINNHIFFFSLTTNDYADYDILSNEMTMHKFYFQTTLEDDEKFTLDENICDLNRFIDFIVER